MKFMVLAACLAVCSAAPMVTHSNGAVVPADTAPVAAPKLAHAAAGPVVVTHTNGAVVPADTPSVYAAKQAHAAAGGVVHAVPAGPPCWTCCPPKCAELVAARKAHLAAHL